MTQASTLLVALIVACPVTAMDASLLPGCAPKSIVAVPIALAMVGAYRFRYSGLLKVTLKSPAVLLTVPKKSTNVSSLSVAAEPTFW